MTTEAIMQRKKGVTRRHWKDKYAALFHRGDLFMGWDRSPRNGGKPIALCRVKRNPYKERLEDMNERHFRLEGGTMYWKDREEFIYKLGGPGTVMWVLEFEIIEVAGEDPDSTTFHQKARTKKCRTTRTTRGRSSSSSSPRKRKPSTGRSSRSRKKRRGRGGRG
jgi:hypothetical protein